ncbi:MAG: hypothetical protein JSV34_02970 [Candidatus Omnitrophota bacterium]|nr:MAG: hypothetical protein JSV34_02970 [Candidatus Omnitrophota bacterium]
MINIIIALFFVVTLLIGAFLVGNPALSLEIQRKFYEKINWRVEPIDMRKEIRNTRIMGVVSVIIAAVGIVVVIAG